LQAAQRALSFTREAGTRLCVLQDGQSTIIARSTCGCPPERQVRERRDQSRSSEDS
jgi:hypothetical protein